MTAGSHIRAVGQDAAQDAKESAVSSEELEPLTLEDEWVDGIEDDYADEEEFLVQTPDRSWILPTLAAAAIIGWTTLFVWPIYPTILAGAALEQWVAWISTWSLPVLLICTLWLLAMRNSKREAARFSDTASQLGRETADLEAKLATINRELSLAREFLAVQTRELEYFGRSAAENLSSNADALQKMIKAGGDNVQTIAKVSETALGNMEKLRDDLPVVTNAARDASNQIGNAGKTADDKLQLLVSGFERLNTFGKASNTQVQSISAKIDKALAGFEAQIGKLDKVSEARFDGLKAKSKAFRNELNTREVDALAAMRRRADDVKAQADELFASFTEQEEKSLELLRGRMAILKTESTDVGAELVKTHDENITVIRESKEQILAELSQLAGSVYAMDEKANQSAKARMEALFKEASRFDEILAARDGTFEKKIAERQDQFETREAEASKALDDRLSAFDTALSERAKDHIAHAETITKQGEAIANRMFDFNRLIDGASQVSEEAKKSFTHSLADLTSQIAQNEAKLGETKSTLKDLTEDGIRLLEIIQSGAQQSREELPQAIDDAASKLSSVEGRASELNSLLKTTSTLGNDLSDYVLSSADNVAKVDDAISAANAKFVQHNDENLAQVRSLQGAVDRLGKTSEELTEKTQTQLNGAIERLESATTSAFASLEKNLENSLSGSTDNISDKAVKALEKSIQSHSEEAIARLEQAANQAAATGRETAVHLRDQLAKVNDLAGNLEQRVSRAREQAEERIDNDFARRMALITESLNSHAIDISKSLSSDVSDTAWAAYLKGDRGIFTRRAVRLVDNTEARELSDLYESDDAFREHVSRFIHDFEGMLRSVLSTRDGNALGVTVLGSDMGKLYVALAQAIDRLRN